jgi:hypothetical protein
VVFVLKETQPEAWISNGGDFSAYLKPPGVDEVVDRVCVATQPCAYTEIGGLRRQHASSCLSRSLVGNDESVWWKVVETQQQAIMQH